MTAQGKVTIREVLNLTVIVAALGTFVDVFDITLFSIVRVSSLGELGFSGPAGFEQGIFLQNTQMVGMLVGGILFGVTADKLGRRSVLFSSILLYSLGTFLNGFVHSIETYAVFRFISGVGLAGEVGAGVTLIAESMRREVRGYGTMVCAGAGLTGTLAAAFISNLVGWRTVYVVGGVLGLLVLLLRSITLESTMFAHAKATISERGNFLSLFTNRDRFRRYFACIIVGLPIWFFVGILTTFAPEIAAARQLESPVTVADAFLVGGVAMIAGEFFSGYLCQKLRSRRRGIAINLLLGLILLSAFVTYPMRTSTDFYILFGLLIFGARYWIMFVTMSAEQFGTDLRGTVSISALNIVRGAVVPMSLLFKYAGQAWGIVNAVWIVGGGVILVALITLRTLGETFHRDLDYTEASGRAEASRAAAR